MTRFQSILIALFLVFVAVSCQSDSFSSQTPKCQKHASYDACGPNQYCYPTCGGPRGPACIPGCNPGCFCKTGYILNVADGKCIRPENCKP